MNEHDLNEKLKKFLISRREAAGNGGYSQSEVADRSGVYGMKKTLDQRAVSRIEQQPLHADAIKLAGYLSAVGISPEEYFSLLSRLTNQVQGNTDMKRDEQVQRILNDTLSLVSQAQETLGRKNHEYLESLNLERYFEGARHELNLLNRKPIIGFFGPFDAGKSTLINTYLGQSVLPTSYQPATFVLNILMHESDKPAFVKGSVALFRKGFMPYMINDTKAVSDYLIEEGDTSLLARLGVHNHEVSVTNDAHTAILFLDAEILKHVWMLDTPGELSDDDSDASDTSKALSGSEFADGVVYLSSHTGFFKDSDLAFGTNIIRQHPPLSEEAPLDHLLFVQSHCHPGIDAEDVKRVGVITFKRIQSQFESVVFEPWQQDNQIEKIPSPDELTARVQPFWRENDSMRLDAIERLNDMAGYLNSQRDRIIEKGCDRAVDGLRAALRSAMEKLEAKKRDTVERVRSIEEQDARFRQESESILKEFQQLIGSISERKEKDLNEMKEYYDLRFSQEGLTHLIKGTYKDKKQAKAELSSYIGQLLTSRLEGQLKISGKQASDETESLLARWQRMVPNDRSNGERTGDIRVDREHQDIDFEISDFNARAAFIGGLSGLGSLGAMSLYVSTIASNLGAYILVGKAAGVLVSLGLASSVTSVTSFVSMIGGPITIGIGLAIAIGYLVYTLAGVSWEEGMAKKVAEAMRKKNVWNDIEKPIDKFWKDTETAIRAGLKELREKTNTHIGQLKLDAQKAYNVEELNQCIQTLKEARDQLSTDD